MKPFGKAELLARIAAVMRRVDRPAGATASRPVTRRRARPRAGPSRGPRRREALVLTPTEYRLLEALVRADGDIVPHHLLARAGWPAETDPDLLWLKPHLARLRAKVEAAGGPAIVADPRRRLPDRRRGRAGELSGAARRPRAESRSRRSGEDEARRGPASWAASAQSTRQPRASRPASGLKWNHASAPAWPTAWRRQPHEAQVTGAA